MIRLDNSTFTLEEMPPEAPATTTVPAAAAPAVPAPAPVNTEVILERPDVVDARVYRLRSAFVQHNVYVTLGWVTQNGRKRPLEIFFNSKDLTRSPEYAVLTRLISVIFRKTADPAFILEELRGIHDPNGGFFKDGKFVQSFYAEVADVIEQFFLEVGILGGQPEKAPVAMATESSVVVNDPGTRYRICPECNDRGLKQENGCDSCVLCGYSKCDK
ncbi:MAG: hypothetical protein KDC10_10435 [Calditrichaeota bacterium]|nr:hypothetical protein [Calditrichota bacterium]